MNNFEVATAGYFNITVNEDPSCSVNQSMSGIRYDGPRDQSYLYQAGGVWSLNGANSIAVTLPNVEYRAGAVDVSLNNISGDFTSSEVTITEDISVSRNQTRRASTALLSGDCMRPDNVTITLSSPAYEGWATHLESETNSTVGVFDTNETVRLSLSQSQLPQKVNDSRNNVVNLSEPRYMRDVSWDLSAGTISVDKDANNTYSVFAEPLTEDRLDIADIRFLEESTNTTRLPIDVVMVIDESGSMDWEADGDDDSDQCSYQADPCTNKLDVAQTAAKGFIGELNDSKDRAGLVSFEDSGFDDPMPGATYRDTDDGRYLTGDFSDTGINGSIDDLPDDPRGGTDIEHGIFKANNVLSMKSNDVRNKVIIALTDGNNNGCDNDDDPLDCANNRDAMDHINQSARDDITIYTIGVGGDDAIDKAFLQMAADQTGGKFYQAEEANELASVFSEIREDVNEQRFVVRSPLSTNFTTATGEVVTPQIAGGTTNIANYSTGSHTFRNVNDPTAPSKFSHSFALDDDETVHINASTYTCEQYEQIQKTYTNNSNTYSVVRCSDINETAGVKQTYTPDAILLDGYDASPLIDSTPGFWENDLNETLTQYPSVRLNGTTGRLQMESNQAIFVFDLPDSRNSDNKFAVLYQVGLSESESRAEGVLNVNINRLRLES
jgi:Mg-chelatase subunit ChlD